MINRANISDWLNRADYTAEERRNICAQIMSEAQYWDSTQYLRMMHDSTKRPWVGLTDEELPPLVGDNGKYMELQQVRRFYKYIEAKLKEKNHEGED